MKKLQMIVLLIGFVLAGCAGADGMPEVLASPSMGYSNSSVVTRVTVTANSTPTADEVSTAYAVIAFDQATSTARAAATSTAVVVTSTAESKATDQFWAAVTLQVATQQATQTQVVGTQIAGTQQAAHQTAFPLTETALEITQTVEQQELYAEVASIWIWRVGSALFIVGLLITFVVVLYRGIPIAADFGRELGEAKIFEKKTSALRPDDKGRRPVVPTSLMKPGEKLIVTDMAHRATIDPEHDDLSADQALINADSSRNLEAVRVLADTPIGKQTLKSSDVVRKPVPGGIKITNPNQAKPPVAPVFPALPVSQPVQRIAAPALDVPEIKHLFKWDGELLPFGVDEHDQLMRTDPARRPHLMVCGMSGSYKSRSAIRTLVSCSLVSGLNVFVIGKGVDYFPFEDHPNFRIWSVNMRHDAQKVLDLLRRLTDQMDKRDEMLVSRRISTWDRYGGKQTMIVLDDFTGAMLNLHKDFRGEVQDELLRLAFDGRKYGFNLMLGVQRPTGTSVNTDLRSQLARISFRVETPAESRIAIGEEGAEVLPDLHFITKITDDSNLQRGVGFRLEDNEVVAFLQSRPVSENEPMEWIDAEAVDVEPVSEAGSGVSATVSDNPVLAEAEAKAEEEIRIRDAYLKRVSAEKKFSLSDIERDVFGKRGGSYHNAVKRVIAMTENCEVEDVSGVLAEKLRTWEENATATAISQKMPDFGANPA